MSPKDADRMANSVDPDQTGPLEQSDQGLHCLPRTNCPKTYDHCGKCIQTDKSGQTVKTKIRLVLKEQEQSPLDPHCLSLEFRIFIC